MDQMEGGDNGSNEKISDADVSEIRLFWCLTGWKADDRTYFASAICKRDLVRLGQRLK
jgi:hypothetical protein